MRRAGWIALFGIVLVGVACGTFGSTEEPPTSGLTDAAASDALVNDATSDAARSDAAGPLFGVNCGAAVCGMGESCCFDPTTETSACGRADRPCPDGGRQYFCDDGEDCAALGKPDKRCCATYEYYKNATDLQTSATCSAGCSDFVLCKPNGTECDNVTKNDAGTSCLLTGKNPETNTALIPSTYFTCHAP